MCIRLPFLKRKQVFIYSNKFFRTLIYTKCCMLSKSDAQLLFKSSFSFLQYTVTNAYSTCLCQCFTWTQSSRWSNPAQGNGNQVYWERHPCVSMFVSVCVYTCKSMFKDILRLLFTLDETLKVCLRGLHFRLKLGLGYSQCNDWKGNYFYLLEIDAWQNIT